jgi:fermentation-respiration switch protein FrsA (DUF1100 family)
VLHLAAFDRRIKAAVVQVPALGVWRQVVHSAGREALEGLLGLVAADRAARFEGGAVNSLAVVAPVGELSVLGTPDAYQWFREQGDRAASTWVNRITIESLERMVEYDPAGAIELISPTPLLMILAENDSLLPVDFARAVFERAGEPKQLRVLPCGHFDVYEKEPWSAEAAVAAKDWFEAHLG